MAENWCHRGGMAFNAGQEGYNKVGASPCTK